MVTVLIVLVVVSCGLLVGMCSYRARLGAVAFEDSVTDPVFERLVWQAYGDGDWWQGELSVEGTTVTFLIGGTNAPDPTLVADAHTLAATYASFQQTLDQFLRTEAQRRPQEAATIEQLVVTQIALFPERVEHDPEGYQGAFVLLHCREQQVQQLSLQEVWRCDRHDGHFTNLRVWV